MGTRLPGFRSGLDALLPLPVPNHGLDGVGRSAQCNHCNIDHHAQKNLICRIQSTNAGCLAGAVPGWIKQVLDNCRILLCRARWLLLSAGERVKMSRRWNIFVECQQ